MGTLAEVDMGEVTPKYAVINAAGAGDNTIVAAVTGKKIRVISYALVAITANTCRFESGASGTALTGQMSLGITGVLSSGFNPMGHFQTADGALLNLELSAATNVSGHVTYLEVD